MKEYSGKEYEKPSVAADMVVFAVMDNDESNYRKLASKKLQILMVKRGEKPFRGMYSLPGGFLRKGETLDMAAARELAEETGIENAYLKAFGVFSDTDRDPRGWVISNAYLGLVNAKELVTSSESDADGAQWFDFLYEIVSEDVQDNSRITLLKITLSTENTNLTALLRKTHEIGRSSAERTEIIESDIAFDHAMIIAAGYERLREETLHSNIAFNLMPEYFTLSALQRVYEIIFDKKEYAANFRRKISELVVETDMLSERAGHRTSKLYKRNMDKF